MSKKHLRILSFLLMLVILVGVMPIIVFGDEPQTPDTQPAEEERIWIEDSYVHVEDEPIASTDTASLPSTASTLSDENPPVLADGIYGLKSAYMTSSWMKVADAKPLSMAASQYATRQTSPVTDFATSNSSNNRMYLFKITQKGNTGRYIIRSMINNGMGLICSGNYLCPTYFPKDDSMVSDGNTFYIQWNGFGYSISPYWEPDKVLTLDSDDPILRFSDKGNNMAQYTWELSQYTGTHQSGIGISMSSYIYSYGIVLDEYNWWDDFIPVIGWSTYPDGNRVCAELGNDSDYAWGEWDETGRAFYAYVFGFGNFSMTASVQRTTSTPITVFSRTYTYRAIPAEGVYCLQNVASSRYVDVHGPTEYEGEFLQENSFHNGDEIFWILEHAGNGYIRFKSKYSDLCLSIDSDGYVTQRTTTSAPLLKIDSSAASNVIISSVSGKSMTINASFSRDGMSLLGRTYTADSSYTDEWKLVRCRKVYLLAHSNYSDYAYNAPNSIGFTSLKDSLQQQDGNIINSVFIEVSDTWTEEDIIEYMQNCEIFVMITEGRGDGTGIKISSSGTIDEKYLTMDELVGIDLSNLELAVLLSYHIGNNYTPAHIASNSPVNYMEQVHLCGAEAVVGFQEAFNDINLKLFGFEFINNMDFYNSPVYEATWRNIDFYNNIYNVAFKDTIVVAGNQYYKFYD